MGRRLRRTGGGLGFRYQEVFAMTKNVIRSAALVAALAVLSGCGKEAEPAKVGKEPEAKAAHAGWWCDEHGVPEKECSMCSEKVFKKLKPEEICKKHSDRAAAQCFICNPELWATSAAVYKANTGKEPPEPTENLPPKK